MDRETDTDMIQTQDKRRDGWMDGCMYGKKDKQDTDSQTRDRHTHSHETYTIKTDRQTDEKTYRQKDRWTREQMDG